MEEKIKSRQDGKRKNILKERKKERKKEEEFN